jgi:TolB-like protein/Tfp pilus assembly protein PilF
MTNSGTVDQVQAALAAFLEAKKTLVELEAVLTGALQSGLWTPALVMDVLRDAVAVGRVPPEMLRRLGLGEPSDATVARAVDSPESIASSGAQHVFHEPIATGRLVAGRYRLERKLGEGGMGVVYLASDQEVKGETFAIKVLVPEIRDRPEALELMREEVRKTRALAHPNIVGVYSLNVDRSDVFILMECLEGKTLQALLDEDFGRGMRFDRAWPLIEDLGAALAYAHDHSVIHGDLKPANIFVTTSGRAKLLDFGIARAARGSRRGKEEAALAALTPAYASCEMLEYLPPDTRDDIYALAIIIYEMLSGKHPFGGRSAIEARGAGEKPTPIASLTERQNAALAHGLAFGRAARTATVETLLAGLAPGAGPDKRRAALAKATAVAALLIVVAVALAYFFPDKLWLGKRVSMTAATSRVSDKSIAVLPFADLSEKHDQEYFGDGMAEDILDLLAKLPHLKVIGRTSSFQFKGRNEDLRQIASTLGAEYVVEGSVQRSGDHLRVTAQLIDARDGAHRWSETYDRKVADAMQLQDEIAASLVRALQLEVADPNGARARSVPSNSEAYDIYLHGLHAFNRYDEPGFSEAIADFQHAVSLDPRFLPAHEQLARTLCDQPSWGFVAPQVGFEQARAAASEVVRLDSQSAMGHAILACVNIWYDWDWDAAKKELATAISLEPRNPFVLVMAMEWQMAQGRLHEALRLGQTALAADPLNAGVFEEINWINMRLGDYAAAEIAARRTLQISPTFVVGHHDLASALLLQGRAEAALEEAQKETVAGGRGAVSAMAYQALHRQKEADSDLLHLKVEHSGDMAFWIAEVYAFAGQRDQALSWLDRAYAQKDFFLWTIKDDPLFRNLEREPRYAAFLRRMNLP